MTEENMFSKFTDHELVEARANTCDPMALEMLEAEERRRNNERALKQARTSNKIAIASLVIATLSFIIAAAPQLIEWGKQVAVEQTPDTGNSN